MARKETNLYLDEALLQAVESAAVRRRQSAQDIVEAALRDFLNFDVIEQVWERNTLSEEEAMKLAYEELDAIRASRG